MSGPYLGKFRGTVVANIDPEGRGRIRATVPGPLGVGEISNWAEPCVPFAGSGSGMFVVPPVNSLVWIEFEQGEKEFPIWTGGFWQSKLEMPDSVLSATGLGLVLKTLAGSTVTVDDTPGKGGITLKSLDGTALQLGVKGITLKSKFGELTIGAAGITLKTATGQKLTIGTKSIKLTNGVASLEMIGKMVRINGQSLVVL